MNLFENQESMYDGDNRRPSRDSPIARFFIKILLTIVALPAVIVGAIHFWTLFGYGRLRLSVISCITILELLIVVPLVGAFHPLQTIGHFFTFSGEAKINNLLFAYLLICIIAGIVGAYILDIVKVYQFKTNPSLLFMDGWAYQFSYRKTPVELLRIKFLKKTMNEGKCYSEEEAPLGILEEPILYQGEDIDDSRSSLEVTHANVVGRSYHEAVKHTLVTGATGSGKTVSLLSLIYNDILCGYPVCVVDFKKSSDVLYFLSKWAKDLNRDFYYFANGTNDDLGNDFYYQKATYDPFSSGEQSSRSDVILSLREWDTASDVYKGRTESLLNALFFALLSVDHDEVPRIPWSEGGINQIIAAMDLTVMYDLIMVLNKKREKGLLDKTDIKRLDTFTEIYQSLITKTPEGKALREQLDGIKLICNKLIMSSYGNWLSKGMSKKHIDLLKIATSTDGPIVLFGLSGMEEPEFARALGSIISSDLKRTVNIKNGMSDRNRFGIYIDEFQTLDPNDVTDLLEKARSAQAFCTLATQSLEKISSAAPINGEATLRSILDTCGNYLFHSGAKEDSGERMAKILGKTNHIRRRVSTKANSKLFSPNILAQRQGVVNKEIEEDWIIPPSKFQNLSVPTSTNGYKSEAYFITNFSKNDGSAKTVFGAQKIQVIAQNEITQGISADFEDFIKTSTAERHLRQTGEDIRNFSNKHEKNEVDDVDFLYLSENKLSKQPEPSDNYSVEDLLNVNGWGIDEIDEIDDNLSETASREELTTKVPIDEGIGQGIKTIAKPKFTEAPAAPKTIPSSRPLTSFERMKLEQSKSKKTTNKKKKGKEVNVQEVKPEQGNPIASNGFKLPDL